MKMGRWKHVLLLTVLVCYVPTNYAAQSWQLLTDTIRKSTRDDRQYRAIQLDNGIKVLLVSDKQSVKSLAALALPVGSLQDPNSQQGLAHYLEHMILMGSKKYPEPHAFAEFLSKNAGRYNASTAPYRTSYYFEVDDTEFEPTLDRLADAIANPLFDVVNADKERNAVNAELTMARSRDGMRMQQVDSETINSLHPASKFFGGNLETLSDKENSRLHDELLAFYQHYYSANLMVAVLYADRGLDELADLAAKTFGQIENRQATVEPITEQAITDNEKGIVIHYVPAKPFRELSMSFPIDNNIADFQSKSDAYIGYLIGNRSQHTLADWLQKQGFIESISAGANPRRYGNSGHFVISAELTEKGEKHRDAIISAIFSYVQQMAKSGVDSRYYDEIKHVLDLDFLYPEINRDMSYVEYLTDSLLQYPVEHVLDADYVASNYDPAAITSRLAQLTPENARIWFIGPNEPTDKEAYFVEAKYQREYLTTEKINEWKQQAGQLTFELPALNTYIPTNFERVNAKPEQIENPTRVLNKAGMRAFYFPSFYFADEPKISLNVLLENDHALENAKNRVLFALMDYLAGKKLDELRYQASVAGISFSTTSQNGLSILASGFSQHLPELLLAVVKGFQEFSITPAQLAQAKSWYKQALDEMDSEKAFELAVQPIRALSDVPYSERRERREIVETLTVNDVLHYRDNLLKNVTVSLIASGNISASETRGLTERVHQQLGTKNEKWVDEKYVKITKPVNATLEQLASSSDSALMQVFIPADYDRIDSAANSRLLSTILHPWFFDQLRSKEQLGYALFSFPSRIGERMGLSFLIQSNTQGPDYLASRYAAFYQQTLEKLNALSDDEFAQYKNGLLLELTKRPQTMNAELSDYMGDFTRQYFTFDSKARLIKRLETLTKAEMVKYFNDAVISPTGLVLSSRVVGKNQPQAEKVVTDKSTTVYKNAAELQRVLLDAKDDKK